MRIYINYPTKSQIVYSRIVFTSLHFFFRFTSLFVFVYRNCDCDWTISEHKFPSKYPIDRWKRQILFILFVCSPRFPPFSCSTESETFTHEQMLNYNSLSLSLCRPRSVTFFFTESMCRYVAGFGLLLSLMIHRHPFSWSAHTDTHADIATIVAYRLNIHYTYISKAASQIVALVQTRLFLRFNWDTNFLRYHFFFRSFVHFVCFAWCSECQIFAVIYFWSVFSPLFRYTLKSAMVCERHTTMCI